MEGDEGPPRLDAVMETDRKRERKEEEEEEKVKRQKLETEMMTVISYMNERDTALLLAKISVPNEDAEFVPVTGMEEFKKKKGAADTYICKRGQYLVDSLEHFRLNLQSQTWNLFESGMRNWEVGIEILTNVLLPTEKKRSYPIFGKEIFIKTVKNCVTQLMGLGEKQMIDWYKPNDVLDMQLTLNEAICGLLQSSNDYSSEYYVNKYISSNPVLTFGKLKIDRDSKLNIDTTNVHPISIYIMSYINFLAEFINLVQEDGSSSSSSCSKESITDYLGTTLTLLIDQLKFISKKFDNSMAIKDIFLLNNHLYIINKLKVAGIGKGWMDENEGETAVYVKSYLQNSWGKFPDGLKVVPSYSSSSSDGNMKERITSFNTQFDLICKTQSNWIVDDDVVRSSLQVAILKDFLGGYHLFYDKLKKEHLTDHASYTFPELEERVNRLFER